MYGLSEVESFGFGIVMRDRSCDEESVRTCVS